MNRSTQRKQRFSPSPLPPLPPVKDPKPPMNLSHEQRDNHTSTEPYAVSLCPFSWPFGSRSLDAVKSMNRFESMGNPSYDNRMILSRHDSVAKSPSVYSEYSAVKSPISLRSLRSLRLIRAVLWPFLAPLAPLPPVRNSEFPFCALCVLLWQFLPRSLHPVKSMNRFESMRNPSYDNRNPRHSGSGHPAHRLANPPPSQR
jgi:hypothetical protein